MIFDLSDTIVAISSAPGYSMRGIVRLSGMLAAEVVGRCWLAGDDAEALADFANSPTWQPIKGRFALTASSSVPAEAVIFRPPASYTAEIMVELHLPGSQKLLNMVLEKLLGFDCVRMAGPGEFTGRAFLNGRIDLTEAEAVAEVIHASGDAQLRAAENLMAGMLHKKCRVYSETLADLLALVEAGIDFSDQEDVVFIESERLIAGVDQIAGDIERLLADSESWQDLHNLAKVVLAGPPNAGKSSLVNRLTGLDRSIVCSIAGTTRDILTAPVKLELGECLLIDTPGLGEVQDILGRVSQERVDNILREANLVLLIWDPAETVELPAIIEKVRNLARCKCLSVANKKDLFVGDFCPSTANHGQIADVFISAETGENVDILLEMIAESLHFGINNDRTESIALTNRQNIALMSTCGTLHELSKQLKNGLNDAEIVALELREALDHIGSISGEIATEEVLGRIFSRFCIGK